jgi:hypothetical protein
MNQYKTHITNNTKHSKYKYIYYQNTRTIVKTHTHTLTHILHNKLKFWSLHEFRIAHERKKLSSLPTDT